MRYIQGTELNVTDNTAVTLGKFDGIHLGHQFLLNKVLKAKSDGLKSVVFTFHTPPKALMEGQFVPQLSTNEEKVTYLERAGVDYLVEYPFNQEVCHMTPDEFIREILIKGLNAKYLAVGTDFGFGYRRAGTSEFLKEGAADYGFKVDVVEKLCDHTGREISSSYIREELAAGNMEAVRNLLGRSYSVLGEVVHGNHLGRTFGMPTINQLPEPEKQLPPNGVYVSQTILEGKMYGGVTNIGQKPTIEGTYPKGLETYIFGLNEDVYGKTVEVQLLHFVRAEMKFNTKENLQSQMKKDADIAAAYLKAYGKTVFNHY